MHTPVLLDRVLEHIHTPQDKRYIDCTLGEGGHARAIARLGIEVLALDADASQVSAFVDACHEQECSRITAIVGNFRRVGSIAIEHGFQGCDGVLMDLGLSMRQYAQERGFSYKRLHQPLDMVIGTDAKQGGTTRAADVVGLYSEEQLRGVFERYGEDTRSSDIAHAIVSYRSRSRIHTVEDLRGALDGVVAESSLPRIFQALRIEVNDEFNALQEGLNGAYDTVRAGGHIQVISFHSGEDRIVKLWGRSQGLRMMAKYVGRYESDDKWEQSAVLRVYIK